MAVAGAVRGVIYEDAPEDVVTLAQAIISDFQMKDAQEAKIKFLLKICFKSAWGECHLTHGPWRYLCPNHDYVITLWESLWKTLSLRSRQALLHHELSHIMRTLKGGWKLREHDLVEFTSTVQAFGAWSPALLLIKDSIESWGQINDEE